MHFYSFFAVVAISECPVLEIEAKYEKKMRSLREELELRRKTEIHEIEEVSCDNIKPDSSLSDHF